MRDVYRCVKCGKFTEDGTHCGSKAQLILRGRERLRLSKLMTFLLRHSPESAGLSMDAEGWVSIEELVRGIRERWVRKELYSWVGEEHVVAVATLDPKGRFEVKGGRIRARYGHSRELQVSLNYVEDRSVRTLYHGTTSGNVKSILREGIKPMRRKYVHLTVDPSVACETASRHGPGPTYLVIDAECLREAGIKVLKASELIRLAERVPPECIIEVRKCS